MAKNITPGYLFKKKQTLKWHLKAFWGFGRHYVLSGSPNTFRQGSSGHGRLQGSTVWRQHIPQVATKQHLCMLTPHQVHQWAQSKSYCLPHNNKGNLKRICDHYYCRSYHFPTFISLKWMNVELCCFDLSLSKAIWNSWFLCHYRHLCEHDCNINIFFQTQLCHILSFLLLLLDPWSFNSCCKKFYESKSAACHPFPKHLQICQ